MQYFSTFSLLHFILHVSKFYASFATHWQRTILIFFFKAILGIKVNVMSIICQYEYKFYVKLIKYDMNYHDSWSWYLIQHLIESEKRNKNLVCAAHMLNWVKEETVFLQVARRWGYLVTIFGAVGRRRERFRR